MKFQGLKGVFRQIFIQFVRLIQKFLQLRLINESKIIFQEAINAVDPPFPRLFSLSLSCDFDID